MYTTHTRTQRTFLPKAVVLVLLALLSLVLLAGCSWVGHTTGKAKAKIERKVDATEKGYHDGYSEEKNKSAPKSDAADTPVQ